MINKKKTGIFNTVLVCFSMIVLILLSFVGIVFGNQDEPMPKNISVILYYSGEGGWDSLKQGISQAEKDFSVNVNYVTLRNRGDAAEQMKAVENETANGAEGILIAVADDAGLCELWKEKKIEIPVVALESGFDELSVPLISTDDYEMGKMLGETILEDLAGKEDPVIAVELKKIVRNSVNKRKQGLLDSLDGKASVVSIEAVFKGIDVDAAAALDKESLLTLAGSENKFLSSVKKYGIGNTASIVAALEHDQIEKIVFQNEFNVGYVAVETLMTKINGTAEEKGEEIEFYCVGVTDIYDAPYERLLFPIVE